MSIGDQPAITAQRPGDRRLAALLARQECSIRSAWRCTRNAPRPNENLPRNAPFNGSRTRPALPRSHGGSLHLAVARNYGTNKQRKYIVRACSRERYITSARSLHARAFKRREHRRDDVINGIFFSSIRRSIYFFFEILKTSQNIAPSKL